MEARTGRPPAPQRGGQPQLPPSVDVFLALGGVAIVALTILAPLLSFQYGFVHTVPEGYVGVYWRGGALLKSIAEPGYHMLIPFLTKSENIQVTMQTDEVTNIPCGTKGGVMIFFDKIEVVNRLRKDFVYSTIKEYGVNYDKTWIYDKIHHEINQFCSAHSLQEVYIDHFDQIDEQMKEAIKKDIDQYAPGIEIIGVRVTKPKIPENIARNYELMEEERTKVLIAMERQRVAQKEKETEKQQALSEAEKSAQVSQILMGQKLAEKESYSSQQEIENQVYLARQKALADADSYRAKKEAEANSLKLTKEFLELKFIESISNNAKIFFGEKIPGMFTDQRLLASMLFQSQSEDKSTQSA